MPNFLRSIRQRLKRPTQGPAICVTEFTRSDPSFYRPQDLFGIGRGHDLCSELCRYDRLYSKPFQDWLALLREVPRPHRKQWELAYILQALKEHDAIGPGRRGLGFAVGTERTPALLASLGCEIVASDLDADDERNAAWAATGQWAGGLRGLSAPDLCPEDVFQDRVRYRAVDMNAIPGNLTGFDFTWSTCSFEHCGTLDLGIRFLERQMDCLKLGGVAVHTTEFNLTSNQETWESGGTSIFRLRDIEQAVARLRAAGHKVLPLDLTVGRHPLDRYVDLPVPEPPHYSADRHLRLALGPFACTSIGLIIVKSGHSPEARH